MIICEVSSGQIPVYWLYLGDEILSSYIPGLFFSYDSGHYTTNPNNALLSGNTSNLPYICMI